MKAMLISMCVLFSMSCFANNSGTFEYEETVTKIDRDSGREIDEAKEELVKIAENSCRIHDVVGQVTRISDFEIVNVPEQISNDPRCEWRGNCYMPARISVTAKFRCEFQ